MQCHPNSIDHSSSKLSGKIRTKKLFVSSRVLDTVIITREKEEERKRFLAPSPTCRLYLYIFNKYLFSLSLGTHSEE